MSKKITFTVEVEFEDNVTKDNDINDVADSILIALVSEVNNGGGLAPVDSETFTKAITVTKSGMFSISSEYSVTKKIF